MRPNILYKNFSYSDILTKFISEELDFRLDYEALKSQKIDEQFVEILFFRPHSFLRNKEIIFECRLEAVLPWRSERISATCQDRRFWQALRRSLSLLIKQMNLEIQKYRAKTREINGKQDFKWILEHWEYGQYEH